MNDELAKEMLRSIASSGSVTKVVHHIIANSSRGLSNVLNLSSGSPRLQTNVINKFKFILSQPAELSVLNPFEIRCALCHKVISYPCWYYSIKYAVNHFHYFVCFDSDSKLKPNTKCYRREG